MPPRFTPARSLFGVPIGRGLGARTFVFALECALGAGVLLLTTACARVSAPLQSFDTLLSLLVILLAAVLCGFWQAIVVALFAVGFHAALVAPPFTLHTAFTPANALLLLLFALGALLVSRLAARNGLSAHQAESWGGQMHDLYEFTRRTLQLNLHIEPGPQLAELVHEIFGLEAVALFDADLHQAYQAGYWSVDPQEQAQNVYYFETSDDDPETGLGRRVVRLGNVPVGSLLVRGNTTPLTNNIIAALIALTFDRYRAFANENRIETERRTEQLRATVLDSLAHAYKTPLTAIRAAGTGLAEMGRLSPGQAELVALINEQTSLLSELTTRLLTTARLDAGKVTLHATPVSVSTLVEEVLAGLKDRLASMKVAVDLQDESLTLNCDPQLMNMLLTQYLDNACKYSILGTTITVRVLVARTEAIFSVHSYGPVIPIADRERIFDRYYRSSTYANRASGTGIGLSVAKRAAMIHGGHVWVTSDEHAGTTFFAAIPITATEKGTTQ